MNGGRPATVYLYNLMRKVRNSKASILAGADQVEWPSHNDTKILRLAPLIAKCLCCNFADRIWVAGAQRLRLPGGQIRFLRSPIDVG